MKVRRFLFFILLIVLLVFIIVKLVEQKKDDQLSPGKSINSSITINNELSEGNVSENADNSKNIQNEPTDEDNHEPTGEQEDSNIEDQVDSNSEEDQEQTIQPDTDAESISVIVNPNFKLPGNHEPKDLVYPDVRFIFNEKIEKRMLREEAAKALELMFEAAEVDGIYLAGVSGYRSHSTQTALFNRYVERDGLEKARTYSAEPGTSEHETGLAIDVTSSDGKCAAQDCFGGTPEAIWLENNAANFGFIIRYPKGKEEITGYKYEPWHLRYVGEDIAKPIAEQQITLEEYYGVEPVQR